jgi:hypothetical protein
MQNFSIPDSIPESIITASVLNAALATPANDFALKNQFSNITL